MSDEPCRRGDEAWLHRVGGSTLVERHRADHRVELGFAQELQDGQSLHGLEVIQLSPNGEGGYTVETVFDGRGPPQVATAAYREGWDRTFGRN